MVTAYKKKNADTVTVTTQVVKEFKKTDLVAQKEVYTKTLADLTSRTTAIQAAMADVDLALAEFTTK